MKQDWEIRAEKIQNKEICRTCYEPFPKDEGFFVDRYDRNQKFMGREHYSCLGDVICRKCGKHVSDFSGLGMLLSPMQDRCSGEGIDDIERVTLCYQCYKLVFHFANAKIGVEACT